MNAPDNGTRGWRDAISAKLDYTPFPYLRKGLPGSWQTPPRPGIYRLIAPWAYRHTHRQGRPTAGDRPLKELRMTPGATPLRIAIVGGGIGGLATAAFLRRAGLASTVYEQAARLTEVGAGLVVAPNAPRPRVSGAGAEH